jgi:hypothetical protein
MAFGYEYWMVFLPAFNRESFLLFVHNPAGSTKLRNYSGGREKVVGNPESQRVRSDTVIGETRFHLEPHPTTDVTYWSGRTLEFNSRYLPSTREVPASVIAAETQVSSGIPDRNATHGRAQRGSRRQLQDYVNQHESALTSAVMEALPSRLRELGARIKRRSGGWPAAE